MTVAVADWLSQKCHNLLFDQENESHYKNEPFEFFMMQYLTY